MHESTHCDRLRVEETVQVHNNRKVPLGDIYERDYAGFPSPYALHLTREGKEGIVA